MLGDTYYLFRKIQEGVADADERSGRGIRQTDSHVKIDLVVWSELVGRSDMQQFARPAALWEVRGKLDEGKRCDLRVRSRTWGDA